MTSAELEKRLARVEQEVAQLKSAQAGIARHPLHTLEQIHGIFENDEAFREAARLGRKWRRAQRPTRRKKASGK